MPMYPPDPLEPRDDASPAVPSSHAADHTAERDAINAIVAELGSQPRGTYSTVQARLAYLESHSGSGGSIPPGLLDRLTAVEEAVTAVEAEIIGVAADLLTEEAARAAADTGLENTIGSETSARIAGDATLQSAINAEAATRAAGDAALASSVADEADARSAADLLLDGRLDTAEADIVALEVRVAALEPTNNTIIVNPGGLISPQPVVGPVGLPIDISQYNSLGYGTPIGTAWGYGDWRNAGYWERTLAFITNTNTVFVNLDNTLQRATFAIPPVTAVASCIGRFTAVSSTISGVAASRVWFLPGAVNGGATANLSAIAYLSSTAWVSVDAAVSSRLVDVDGYWYWTQNTASAGRLYRMLAGAGAAGAAVIGSTVNVGGNTFAPQKNVVAAGGRVWFSLVQSSNSARGYSNTSGTSLFSAGSVTNQTPEGAYSTSTTALFYDRAVGVTADGKRMNLSFSGSGTARRTDLVVMDTAGSAMSYGNVYSRPLDSSVTNPVHDGLQAPNDWLLVAVLAADGKRYLDAVNAAGYVNLAGPFTADVTNLHWAYGQYGSKLRFTVGTVIYEQTVTWA